MNPCAGNQAVNRKGAAHQMCIHGEENTNTRCHQPCRHNSASMRRWALLWLILAILAVFGMTFAKLRPEQNGPKRAARMLTAKIKNAETAADLVEVVSKAVDRPVFDHIHLAATYAKLGAFQKMRQLPLSRMTRSVLVKLERRLLQMLEKGQIDPQGLSNILWAAAHLFVDAPVLLKIVPALSAQIPSKASDMIAQHLSNSLWATVQLKEAVPEVLQIVPALVAQVPVCAADMTPQHVSNSLWAAAVLRDAAPAVLQMVPYLVAQVPLQAGHMLPQALANSLWAAATLQDASPDVLRMVPSIVAQIELKVDDMNPQDVSNILWAAADLWTSTSVVLKVVPCVVAQVPFHAGDMIPQALSNSLYAATLLQTASPKVLEIVPILVTQLHLKMDQMSAQNLAYGLQAVIFFAERLRGLPIREPAIWASALARVKQILRRTHQHLVVGRQRKGVGNVW